MMARHSDEALARLLQAQFDEELHQVIEPVSVTENLFSNLQYDAGPPPRESTNSNPLSIIDPKWELLDPTPDIRALFLQYNRQFFWGRLEGVEVKWSPRMTSCAGLCCYEGYGGLCSVRLSTPLLKLRPRKDLVETLLHEMIHAYLFVTQNNKDHDSHGLEFCKHMNRINSETGTKISIYHTFHDEVNLYKVHWWKCDGPCQKRPPYFGLVKRSMNRAPGPSDSWYSRHQASCGGTYTKIKEPEDFGSKKRKKKGDSDKEESSGKKQKTYGADIRKFIPFSGKGICLGDKASSSSKPSSSGISIVRKPSDMSQKISGNSSGKGIGNRPPSASVSNSTKSGIWGGQFSKVNGRKDTAIVISDNDASNLVGNSRSSGKQSVDDDLSKNNKSDIPQKRKDMPNDRNRNDANASSGGRFSGGICSGSALLGKPEDCVKRKKLGSGGEGGKDARQTSVDIRTKEGKTEWRDRYTDSYQKSDSFGIGSGKRDGSNKENSPDIHLKIGHCEPKEMIDKENAKGKEVPCVSNSVSKHHSTNDCTLGKKSVSKDMSDGKTVKKSKSTELDWLSKPQDILEERRKKLARKKAKIEELRDIFSTSSEDIDDDEAIARQTISHRSIEKNNRLCDERETKSNSNIKLSFSDKCEDDIVEVSDSSDDAERLAEEKSNSIIQSKTSGRSGKTLNKKDIFNMSLEDVFENMRRKSDDYKASEADEELKPRIKVKDRPYKSVVAGTSGAHSSNTERTKVIMVDCPACIKKIPQSEINTHLDKCLAF